MFAGEAERAPMGIAVYKRPADGAVFAVVGRKSGPTAGYVWQYRLEDDGRGCVKGAKVRAFGLWSGQGEIEAIAVDDAGIRLLLLARPGRRGPDGGTCKRAATFRSSWP